MNFKTISYKYNLKQKLLIIKADKKEFKAIPVIVVGYSTTITINDNTLISYVCEKENGDRLELKEEELFDEWDAKDKFRDWVNENIRGE